MTQPDKLIVGEIYEIDPYIKISMNGLPPDAPYFAKLLSAKGISL